MEKEEVPGTAGEEEVKEGPSVEVKQDDVKEPVDVKPNTENLPAVELDSNSKPAGEKYTPKVRQLWMAMYHGDLVSYVHMMKNDEKVFRKRKYQLNFLSCRSYWHC